MVSSLFTRKRWPFSPPNAVMSDIEWSSLENKSHSPKVEQEDRKHLGSCWLPQLYGSTWSTSGLGEPTESELLFLCTQKDSRSYPGNEYEWGRPLRQRNNSCIALRGKQKVVLCGQRAVSEEADKAGELVGLDHATIILGHLIIIYIWAPYKLTKLIILRLFWMIPTEH